MSVLPLSRRSYRVWQRNRDVFLRLWRAEVPPFLFEPLFIVGVFGAGLGTYVKLLDGRSYMEFIAPGIIAGYAMFSAAFECTYGSFIRMEVQRTFDAIIATPLSLEDVIAGEVLWAATRSLMTASAILVVISALGLVASPWAVLALPLAALEGLMFGSMAMFFTSLAPSIYSFNYFFTLFITPMFFFSGVFFPLDSLPGAVQRLAWALPLTPVASMTRGLVEGELSWGMAGGLAYVLGLALFFFYLCQRTMRRRLIK